MKKSEVPQDDANMLEGKFRDPCYVVDENGKYVTELSVGWDAKNVVMQQAWDSIHEKVEETRQKVLDGKLSPLAYHMEKNQMDVKLLSKYVGHSKCKVKRHLKPRQFEKLELKTLEKYAEALRISVDVLKNVE